MPSLFICASYETFRPLSAILGDVAHVCNTYNWSQSFNKFKRSLTFILVMCFLWNILCVANYFHYCEACSRLFYKLPRALVEINTR